MPTAALCILLATSLLPLCAPAGPRSRPLDALIHDFAAGYAKCSVPGMSYDYKDYFSGIPDKRRLEQQEAFFIKQHKDIEAYDRNSLSAAEAVRYDRLRYEIELNRERIRLERAWLEGGRKMPEEGLFRLEQHAGWYRHFIRKYTGLYLSPEDIMQMGLRDVARAGREICSIRLASPYPDSAAFFTYLSSETFAVRDKEALAQAFGRSDSIIRKHLPAFVGAVQVLAIHAMEWSGADERTPPGMYMNSAHSPYGKDVFLYNFYNGRYNSRAIEWLYLHEAIPGHHLQASFRKAYAGDKLQSLFLYPGNFEGWACYVEFWGKDLGMYADPYSALGHWEWDLVRSVRLVLDAGIHYYGWSRLQALHYWQQHIPGQAAMAEREISRVTAWPAQALSYKAGADCIAQLRQEALTAFGSQFDARTFHRTYLSFGMRPLAVIRQHFQTAYRAIAQS